MLQNPCVYNYFNSYFIIHACGEHYMVPSENLHGTHACSLSAVITTLAKVGCPPALAVGLDLLPRTCHGHSDMVRGEHFGLILIPDYRMYNTYIRTYINWDTL